MKTKIASAQIEVWKWKENLYNELKDVQKNERLSHIDTKVKGTIEKIKRRKNNIQQL